MSNDQNQSCFQSNSSSSSSQKIDLSQLSTQLISSGFLRRPLPPSTFVGGSLEGQELLLKAIWSLLGSRSKEISVRESLMAKQREILYEHSRIEGFLSRCQKHKLEAEQESTANKNRADAIQIELETERVKHRKTREELNRLKNSEKLIRTTSVHEIRRKTNELSELQRRLTRLIDSKDIIPSRLILSGQALIGSRIETDPGGRIGLLEFDLQTSKGHCDLLRSENQQLRSYLDLYESQILSLISEVDEPLKEFLVDQLDRSDGTLKNTTITSTSESINLSTIYARLSLITYKLRDKVLELSNSLENSKSSVKEIERLNEEERSKIHHDHLKQRQALEIEIESLRASLADAEAMIDGWAKVGFGNENFLEEAHDLDGDKSAEMIGKSLRIQVEALSAERKKFTEEAIALGKQRAELELQKLEDERKKILEELETDNEEPVRDDEKVLNPEHKQPETVAEDRTLDSLVVFTKHSSTVKKVEPRNGKAKSSSSKALSMTQNLKNKSTATTTVKTSSSSTLSRPGVRERAATLKSLMSTTGGGSGGGKVQESSTSNSKLRSSPRINSSRTSGTTRGRSTLSRGSSRFNGGSNRTRSNLLHSMNQA
ncbi:hypothetical protein BY996DRAFT_7427894 [Phakopsora pachyrhizi]|nr:hypothetical protein BY996DRAFT_7427894 [Phakopsora pachyrhizi]